MMTSKKIPSSEIQEFLLESDLIIRLPIGFKGLNENHFRIAIKDEGSNRKMFRALEKIDQNLSKE